MAEMKYETAVIRLEEIVAKLEQGGLELDEMITLFDEGTRLAAYCNKCLDNAMIKIEGLSKASGDENA